MSVYEPRKVVDGRMCIWRVGAWGDGERTCHVLIRAAEIREAGRAPQEP